MNWITSRGLNLEDCRFINWEVLKFVFKRNSCLMEVVLQTVLPIFVKFHIMGVTRHIWTRMWKLCKSVRFRYFGYFFFLFCMDRCLEDSSCQLQQGAGLVCRERWLDAKNLFVTYDNTDCRDETNALVVEVIHPRLGKKVREMIKLHF